MAGLVDIQLPEAVARGVLRGEHKAFADTYRLMAQAVMNLAARILQDRQLAEEVVQDTFMDLVEKFGQIKDANAVVGWVRKVAVNHCLMRLRSPWHTRRTAIQDNADLLDGQADNSMRFIEHAPTLEQALAHLSEEARVVIWLHDVEGYTHKEIGTAMGKTASYSKSQLARAYARLLQWQQRTMIAEARPPQVETNEDTHEERSTIGHLGTTCHP